MTSIYSMTGFGKGTSSNDDYEVTVEIKSVNHRFKDFRFKMGSLFNSFEIELRKTIANNFKRGSFDIHVNYKSEKQNDLTDNLDKGKVQLYLTNMKKIAKDSGVELSINPVDFLRKEFMKESDGSRDEHIKKLALDSLNSAVCNLSQTRSEEGARLVKFLRSHLEEFKNAFCIVEKFTPELKQNIEKKLLSSLDERKDSLQIEESRFLQEVIFYLEKLDVSEELNRIKSHLEKFNTLLNDGGEIGRQVDFLVQELNRETNTLGAKSSQKEVSDQVIIMKNQLEKIREQGLNLE
ncbi:MAG: YicC family protein [Bdellovibrionales bacterium]|nr:YicC family protein [Bdellovibrionales bacterium]